MQDESFFYDLHHDAQGNYYSFKTGIATKKLSSSYYKFGKNGHIERLLFEPSRERCDSDGTICITILDFVGTRMIHASSIPMTSPSNIITGEEEGIFILPPTYQQITQSRMTGSVMPQLYSYDQYGIQEVLSTTAELSSIKYDQDNNIIVCGGDGIYLYREGDMQKKPERYFTDREISDMYQDREGNYWFSMSKDGLLFVPTLSSKVISLNGKKQSSTVLMPEDENLFYYEYPAQINYIDTNDKVYELSPNRTQKLDYVRQLSTTPIFIAEYQGKLYRTTEQSASSVPYFYHKLPNGDEVLSYSRLQIRRRSGSIDISKSNRIKLLEVIPKKTKRFDRELFYTGLKNLYYINLEDYSDTRQVMDEDSLLDVRVNDFDMDSDGELWLATIGNGLLYFRDGTATKYSIEDGLVSDQINTLFLENDSTIWLGTNKGVECLQFDIGSKSRQLRKSRYFNTRDGLLSNYVNDIEVWNDKMWIASAKGLQSIDLRSSSVDTAPIISLQSLEINQEESSMLPDLSLAYDQSDISFTYEGISYGKPEQDFYRYKLSENEKGALWTYTDSRTANFQNLDAGSYTFHVSAQNKNHRWSDDAEYSFRIAPHFSATWWFWILCGIIISATTFYIYRRRLQYLRDSDRKKRTLEDALLRTEIAELSTFRNQFNPHFIFNSLNSIQNFIFKKDVRQANSYLSKFAKLIRESLNLSEYKYVSLDKELQFLKSYLAMEFLRFPDKFKYEIYISDEVHVLELHVPPLLMQPVIENVVKHAFNKQETGQLDIEILLSDSKSQLVIVIRDDGTGIHEEEVEEKKKHRKSFGMKIIKDRIKLLNISFPHQTSTFDVSANTVSRGTTARFVLPIIKSEET